MTLLGKIFTVLIFCMCTMFMAFSVMVYVTHINWKDKVLNEDTSGGKTLGLKKELEQKNTSISKLEEEKEQLLDQLELERAARRTAIASMHSKYLETEGNIG